MKMCGIFNGRRRKPASFVLLDRLLAEQAYVLSYWLSANDEINYRRFFTINNLVGVRVEDPLVFEATHAVVLRLIEKGLVTGLRIDHVDGLRDPHGLPAQAPGARRGRLLETMAHPPFLCHSWRRFSPMAKPCLANGRSAGQPAMPHSTLLMGFSSIRRGARNCDQIYESFIGAQVSLRGLGV